METRRHLVSLISEPRTGFIRLKSPRLKHAPLTSGNSWTCRAVITTALQRLTLFADGLERDCPIGSFGVRATWTSA
jgi:hypothetical protein